MGRAPTAADKRSLLEATAEMGPKAERDGIRRKVFCCSLADVFDNQADPTWRVDLWDMIQHTQHLDWLLLTKRPQNIAKMLPGNCGWSNPDWPWPNVWLGTTVENQTEADRRIPPLLAVPAKVHFLSCEPLLGPLNLRRIQIGNEIHLDAFSGHHQTGVSVPWACGLQAAQAILAARPLPKALDQIDWVISGGESGPNARPIYPDWARSLRNQCAISGVPFFFKQWGDYGPEDPSRKAEPLALADDGTLYRSADLAFPDGARYGEAIRANHDKAHLTMMYRVGKKAAGALLDGCQHREFP